MDWQENPYHRLQDTSLPGSRDGALRIHRKRRAAGQIAGNVKSAPQGWCPLHRPEGAFECALSLPLS
jgi:hypothetical protein